MSYLAVLLVLAALIGVWQLRRRWLDTRRREEVRRVRARQKRAWDRWLASQDGGAEPGKS